MCDYVATPDFRLVVTLWGLATSHGKLWAYPSQTTLTALVRRFHGRALSRRSASRHLGALERDNWIRRVRRHRRARDGSLELHSTLYHLTRRAIRHFAGLAQRTGRALGLTPQTTGGFRCASSGTISVLSDRLIAPGGNGPPPERTKEVARDALARIQGVLGRK